jgi:hypothetical protein
VNFEGRSLRAAEHSLENQGFFWLLKPESTQKNSLLQTV